MPVDKFVDSVQLESDLTSVANAIRTKGGTSGNLSFPTGFVNAIGEIPTGGGGGGGSGIFEKLEVHSFTVSGVTNPNYISSNINFTINHTLGEVPDFVLIYPKLRLVPPNDNQTGSHIRVFQHVVYMDIGSSMYDSAYQEGIQEVLTLITTNQNAKQNNFSVSNKVINDINSGSIRFLGATAYSNLGIWNGDYYAIIGKIDNQYLQGQQVVPS